MEAYGRHGKGHCSYSNGSVYDGKWFEDKFHGKGLLTFTDGSRYEVSPIVFGEGGGKRDKREREERNERARETEIDKE